MRPLTELLDQAEILSNHPDLEDGSELAANLVAGCAVVNEVRQVISQSETHVDANELDDATYEILSDQIDKMRAEYVQACRSIKDKATENQQIMDFWSVAIEKYRVGDCPEYAMLALKKLQLAYPNMVGEVFAIANKYGDDEDADAHEFLVIGRDQNSSPSRFKKWGKNAVICDAWSGDVYSVDQLLARLTCCRSRMVNNRQRNETGRFDPDIHTLKLDFQLVETNKRKNFTSESLSFFLAPPRDEQKELDAPRDDAQPQKKLKKDP